MVEMIKGIPKENMHFVLRLLTPLEREVFESLLRQKVAVSVYDIIKDLTERYISSLFWTIFRLETLGLVKTASLNPWEIRVHTRRDSKMISFVEPVELFSDTFFPGKTYVPLDKFASAVNEYFPKIGSAKSETEAVKYKKELLRQFFPFPSYRRIEKILNEFVTANLVISRKGSGGKEKVLYAVNPEYLPYLLKEPEKAAKETSELKKREQAFENEKLNRERSSTPHSP